MEEIWKSIEGFEELYEVSNFGRVKSLEKLGSVYAGKGKPRKKFIIKEKLIEGWVQEYQVIELRKNGKGHSKKVHRLVAEAFIPNTYGKPQVNHIDENKLNNRLNNLEWVTAEENVNHGTALVRRIKSQSKPILATKEDTKIYFKSIKEASDYLKVNRSCISHSLAGRAKKIKGFTFEFAHKRVVALESSEVN